MIDSIHTITDSTIVLNTAESLFSQSYNWSAVEAIATVLAVIVAVIGIILVVRQLYQARQSQYYQAWRDIEKEISSKTYRNARNYCYNKLPQLPSEATKKDWDNVEQVANCFERVGFCISSKFVPKEVVLDLYASVILRSWEALTDYVEYDRSKRRKSSRRWRHFELLAAQANRYLRRHTDGHQVHLYREDSQKMLSSTRGHCIN